MIVNLFIGNAIGKHYCSSPRPPEIMQNKLEGLSSYTKAITASYSLESWCAIWHFKAEYDMFCQCFQSSLTTRFQRMHAVAQW